jgi:DNA-binding NarL/FixJ family response regulator
MIRLIIADDHPVIIGGIRTILEDQEDIELVTAVNDGSKLLEFLEAHKPDIVLMDINMPGLNGIEATKQIRKTDNEVKILAFSQYREKRIVKQIMKGGANGYLLKSSADEELIKAIHSVMDGGMYLSTDLPNIFESKPKGRTDALFPDLTSREIEVLKLICEEKNNQEIAEALFISPHTVESHRANLLLKVGARNTAGLVKWAVENEVV